MVDTIGNEPLTPTADFWRPSIVVLLVFNLVPVFGIVFLHWKVFPLMFLFWSENVIIGAFNVLKMLMANPESPASWLGKLFLIPFFCAHYGMFTYVHGILVVAFFSGNSKGGFAHAETFWRIIQENDLGWAILCMVGSHAFSFATNYLGNGEYKRASLQMLMNQPYERIVVLHFAILGGGFIVMLLHSPIAGLLLLVAIKTALDLRGYLAERKKFAVVSSMQLQPGMH